jgi:hypothetical protein
MMIPPGNTTDLDITAAYWIAQGLFLVNQRRQLQKTRKAET